MERIDIEDKPLTPRDVKRILEDFCIYLTAEECVQMESMSERELERFKKKKIKEMICR